MSDDSIARMQFMSSVSGSLRTIANCMEAAEKRAREQEATTPEDIEAMGSAIAAVKRGFAEMEKQVREQGQVGPGHEARGRGEIT